MKSSAMMPGAIWWLPRREAGLLREVGWAKMSADGGVGEDGPPKGKCQVGRDALRPALAGESCADSLGDTLEGIGLGILQSSGATVSMSFFSFDMMCERCSFMAFLMALRSTELADERSSLDERSCSWPNTLNSYPTWLYIRMATHMMYNQIKYLGIQDNARRYQKGRIGSQQNAPCAW